ncbi:FMN-binding protein [Leifsonia poae]|uniref:FMN-binding protein n=1 Tax=Leifsonia poae TaxID=110933 RepID=UPI003D66A0EA
MRRNRWRGTILFAVILVVMGSTVGLRLYGVGETVGAATGTSTTTSTSSAATGTDSSGSSSSDSSSSTSTATPSPSASASTSTASATRVITGDVEQTRYGPIQVQVTFEGTKITAITELQYPSDERRSVSINEQAAPILAQEVLASQSANIDTVSGATYTSDGYKQSLQSAIDQL